MFYSRCHYVLPKVCEIKVTDIKVSDYSDIFMTGAIAGSGSILIG